MRWRSALAVTAMLLGLAACQMTEPAGEGPGPKGPPVDVAVFSTPHARVFVDGSEAGTTPTILKLPPGTHEVRFTRDGFKEEVKSIAVESESPCRLEVELVVENPDEATITELAKSMEIEREPFDEEAVVHRGAIGEGITLIWPLGEVRIESLETYRIDVDTEYAGDGFLVFRKGDEVLFREPFNPAELVTVGLVPDEVLEHAGVNSVLDWGVEFDDPGKEDVIEEFKVIRKRRVARRMEMLAKRPHFQRQPALVQEILLADVLRHNGLMTEALQRYLAIAQEWPTSPLPMKGMMTALRRLGLTESWFYAAAAERAEGGGSPELPLPLQAGPDLAGLPESPVPPGPDAQPGPDAGAGSEVADALGKVAADLETAARQARDDGREMTRLARELQRIETELERELTLLHDAETELEEAQAALQEAEAALEQAQAGPEPQEEEHESTPSLEENEAALRVAEAHKRVEEAQKKVDELTETVARLRARHEAALEKSGGMNSDATRATAQALNLRAAQILRTARQARNVAERASTGAPPPVALIEMADALQRLADWFDAEASRIEAGIGEAQSAAEDYASRVEERDAAQEALDQVQVEYDEALAALDPDDPATQQALDDAKLKLEQHREVLAAAEEAVAAALERLSEAMMSTTGLPPDEARAAAAADRERAKALRAQVEALTTAAGGG